MSTASWKAILTAVAQAEGKTLREWSDEIDIQAARMVAAIPEYLRKPNLLPRDEQGAA
jgi:hypothetical protein